MIYYILLTALSVSIDSFFCGFSLCKTKDGKLKIAVIISLTVFVMCFTVNYLTKLFEGIINENSACFGGLILIAIGIYNLIKKEDTDSKTTFQSFLSGFAVGLDGACANISLSLMGYNFFYVPIIIAVMHGIMVYLGLLLSQVRKIKKLKSLYFISPLVLIGLGLYKILGLFI